MDQTRIAEILLEVGAVNLNPTNPFKFASGMLSPIFVDCRVLNSYPKERKIVVDSIIQIIEGDIGKNKIDVVIGTAHSGISLATYIARLLKIPAGYIRASVKDHGKQKQMEGFFKKGSKALLISDIMSTEQEIPISVKAIKDAGIKIVFCLTVFSNDLGFIEEYLKKEKIRFKSLTDLRTLLRVAVSKKRISHDQANRVIEWMNDPQGWDKHRKDGLDRMLERNKEKVGRILLEIGAVAWNLKHDYEYSSGKSGPIYVDNRLLMAYPGHWKKTIDSMVGIIVDQIGVQNVDAIGGTSTAGIPHAAYLAARLKLPLVYVKSKIDEYGKFTRVEGRLERDEKVLLVEDTINTGQSSISAIRALRESGALVEHCLAIFDYGLKDSESIFKNERVRLVALTSLDAVLDVAVARGLMLLEEKATIIARIRGP